MINLYNYFNPYYDNTFFEFLSNLLIRFTLFLTGNLSLNQLVSDEIQMLVLIGVAASSALVGAFLIFRNMTMLANSISHTILVGIVIAFVLTREFFGGDFHQGQESINMEIMLIASLLMGILTSILTEFFVKTVKLQEDASTGLVFTTLFALGIILVTVLTRNAHIGAEVVMGNVDALRLDDFKLVALILIVNSVIFTIFYKEFAITTFDPALASALGYSTTFFNYLLMVQISATVVGAFRAVGVLMVLAFITGLPLTARILTNSLHKMLFTSVALGFFCSIVGVALSRHILTVYGIALSTAGVVVCTIVITYTIALFFAPNKGLYWIWKHKKSLRQEKNLLP